MTINEILNESSNSFHKTTRDCQKRLKNIRILSQDNLKEDGKSKRSSRACSSQFHIQIKREAINVNNRVSQKDFNDLYAPMYIESPKSGGHIKKKKTLQIKRKSSLTGQESPLKIHPTMMNNDVNSSRVTESFKRNKFMERPLSATYHTTRGTADDSRAQSKLKKRRNSNSQQMQRSTTNNNINLKKKQTNRTKKQSKAESRLQQQQPIDEAPSFEVWNSGQIGLTGSGCGGMYYQTSCKQIRKEDGVPNQCGDMLNNDLELL